MYGAFRARFRKCRYDRLISLCIVNFQRRNGHQSHPKSAHIWLFCMVSAASTGIKVSTMSSTGFIWLKFKKFISIHTLGAGAEGGEGRKYIYKAALSIPWILHSPQTGGLVSCQPTHRAKVFGYRRHRNHVSCLDVSKKDEFARYLQLFKWRFMLCDWIIANNPIMHWVKRFDHVYIFQIYFKNCLCKINFSKISPTIQVICI